MKREKITLTDDEFFREIFGDNCPEAFKPKAGEIKSAPNIYPDKEVPSTTPKRTSKRSQTTASKPTKKEMEGMDYDSIKEDILGIKDEIPNSEKDEAAISDTEKSAGDNAADATQTIEANKVDKATMASEVNEATEANDKKDVGNSIENEISSQTLSQSPPAKVSRVSAKMRRASRQEFHDAYLVKTGTKGGSPITIAPDVINKAYWICSLSGNHRARPTYLINNLLREFFKTIEADMAEWSKLD